MESFRTEEEQVEAIRRWWNENGRSTIVAVVIALAAGFGWQGWKDYSQTRTEAASHLYQALLESVNGSAVEETEFTGVKDLAEQLKSEYSGTSYAQFAALHLAKIATQNNDPVEAQAQLRWVLSKASAKSDVAQVAQLRLARVLASSGDTDQALEILATAQGGAYAASYAIAQGDIYMQLGRPDDARNAYLRAKAALLQSAVDGSIATLDQKLQSLNPVPARAVDINPEVNQELNGDTETTESAEKQEG